MANTYYSVFRNRNANNNIDRLGQARVADALLMLIELGESMQLHGTSPENILIDLDKGAAGLRQSSGAPHPYYMAPEVLFDGKAATQGSWIFSLGLLSYFVIYGKPYYEAADLRVTSLPELRSGRTSLIETGSGEPYAEALRDMTILSEDENARKKGVAKMLKTIMSIPAILQLYFRRPEGEAVVTLKIPTGGLNIRKGAEFTADSGQVTCKCPADLHFSFRPGKTVYHISDANASSRSPQTAPATSNAVKMLYLLDCENGNKQIPLFEVGDKPQKYMLQMKRTKPKMYYIILSTPNAGAKIKYRFTVPGNSPDCIFCIEYTPSNSFKICFLNVSDRTPIPNSEMRFTI